VFFWWSSLRFKKEKSSNQKEKKMSKKLCMTKILISFVAIWVALPEKSQAMLPVLQEEAANIRKNLPTPKCGIHKGSHNYLGKIYSNELCPYCSQNRPLINRLSTVEKQMDLLVTNETEEANLRKELLRAQIAALQEQKK
jgi:hypothetical protein